jgi:hypothetical protein
LTPSPIRAVLSTLSIHGVRFLLMGGQACVFYGAAEFSRDTDIVLLADAANMARLSSALADLQAERIAFPPFELSHLLRGHAVHFRCRREDVAGMRIDAMARLRGVDEFGSLWLRRTTVEVPDGLRVELMGVEDLIRAKKTQRDKDWPMVRRLVEAHHAEHERDPREEDVRFWLREARTPRLLADLSRRFPVLAARAATERPLVAVASQGDEAAIEAALDDEARTERQRDKDYWYPLLKELERMRHDAATGRAGDVEPLKL